jgi:cytochrome c
MERYSAAAGAVAALLTAGAAAADGDAASGAQVYRFCASCHSLLPGVHLTGPSLSGVIGRTAGTAEGFGRYSPALREADFEWDAATLDAFLQNPQVMFPGTYMIFSGIPEASQRADLVAFLQLAATPDGPEQAIADGIVAPQIASGQMPPALGDPPPGGRVTSLRHCGDSYFIATADGEEVSYWEKNVRLKIDSAETGPPAGVPVVLGAGMRGDRVSVIFKSLEDLRTILQEKC